MRMGLSPDPITLSNEERGRVDSVIDSGINKFYYPPPGEYNLANATDAQKDRLRRAPHTWSFLQRTTTIQTVDGQSEYTLPTDFASFMGNPTTSRSGGPLGIVLESQIRQLSDSTTNKGTPKYAALRLEAGDGTAKPAPRLVLYPIPDAVEEIKVQHSIAPASLTDDSPWPIAGSEHAEAILSCCLAVAAERSGEDPSLAIQTMLAQLATSIMVDMQTGIADAEGIWPGEGHLDAGSAYFERTIGTKLGYGPNVNTYTEPQRKKVHDIYRSAFRRLSHPLVLPKEKYPHEWTWLRPTVEMQTLAQKDTYTLPPNYGSIEGPITFKGRDGLYRPIKITSDSDIRQRRQDATAEGLPVRGAVRYKGVDEDGRPRYELLLWPTPDASYTLCYRYKVNADTSCEIGSMKNTGSVDGGAAPQFATKSEALGTPAVITLAADPDEFWVLDWVSWSYGADPANGNLRIEIDGVVVWTEDITTGGPGHIEFSRPIYNPAKNQSMVVTLADGGVANKVNIRYR